MADKDTYTYYLPDSNSAPQPYETPVNSIIIIGANGSGKSKLGAWIESHDFEGVGDADIFLYQAYIASPSLRLLPAIVS